MKRNQKIIFLFCFIILIALSGFFYSLKGSENSLGDQVRVGDLRITLMQVKYDKISPGFFLLIPTYSIENKGNNPHFIDECKTFLLQADYQIEVYIPSSFCSQNFIAPGGKDAGVVGLSFGPESPHLPGPSWEQFSQGKFKLIFTTDEGSATYIVDPNQLIKKSDE